MKFCFGDIVVVEGNLIGVVVKSWVSRENNYDVYVRLFNKILNYPESKMERYMVRHKELNEEELEWQSSTVNGREVMSEYRAIYKCRLCGEEFEGISFDDKDEWLSFAMDGFAQGCDSVEIKRDGEKVFVSVNAEHGCKDGSMGMADFLGFRKVGE